MMHAVIEDAHHKEHARRTDAVGDHLEHGPVHSPLPKLRVVWSAGPSAPNADPQHDVTHVRDGTVSHHALEIGLGQSCKCTIDHAQGADGANEPRQVIPRSGADGIAHAYD